MLSLFSKAVYAHKIRFHNTCCNPEYNCTLRGVGLIVTDIALQT